MATLAQLASGNWRAQIQRKGRYVAETFRRRKDAGEWALDTERCIDRRISVRTRKHEGIRTHSPNMTAPAKMRRLDMGGFGFEWQLS